MWLKLRTLERSLWDNRVCLKYEWDTNHDISPFNFHMVYGRPLKSEMVGNTLMLKLSLDWSLYWKSTLNHYQPHYTCAVCNKRASSRMRVLHHRSSCVIFPACVYLSHPRTIRTRSLLNISVAALSRQPLLSFKLCVLRCAWTWSDDLFCGQNMCSYGKKKKIRQHSVASVYRSTKRRINM